MNSLIPSTRFHLGIITGLRFEATIAENAIGSAALPAGGDLITVKCHGPGQLRAAAASHALVELGAGALLSFGVAGGCNPDLPSGTIVLAKGIQDLSTDGSGDVMYTNRGWQHRLKSLLLGNVLLEEGLIASVAKPASDPQFKSLLYQDGSAVAVDMESAAAARVAMEVGIPFMALRVIVDTDDSAIPPAALAGMMPDGTTRVAPIFRALLRHPQDIPGLIGMSLSGAKARKSLRRAAAVAAPLFGGV